MNEMALISSLCKEIWKMGKGFGQSSHENHNPFVLSIALKGKKAFN